MEGSLEQRLETESRLERLARGLKKQAKAYCVDTSASLIYANIVFGAAEYFVAGMDQEELISARKGMSAAGLILYRPFAKFREHWSRWCKTGPDSSRKRKYWTDVSANVTFFAPIYTAVLYRSGASPMEMGIALLAGTATAAVTGRPYGWFLDKWRKLWGNKPTLLSADGGKEAEKASVPYSSAR